MTSRILVSILAILCFCCGSEKEIPFRYNDLVGEWVLIGEQNPDRSPLPVTYTSARGPADWRKLVFHTDTTVETREIPLILTHNMSVHYNFPDYKFRYKLQKDSLFLQHPADSGWSYGRRIHHLTKDSLVFYYKDQLVKYRRAAPLPDSLPTFDAIIVSSSVCDYSCPITSTMIRNDGSVLFFGDLYVDSLGFYKATIQPYEFNEFQNLFREADIENIGTKFTEEDPYDREEEITITFLKDGRIYKTITDYNGNAPADLVWAYARLRHLHRWIKLTKLSDTELPAYLQMHFLSLVKGNTICWLPQSESFLLWNYLYKGKRTTQQATPRFKLRNFTWSPKVSESDNDETSDIRTDGRLYTFFIKGQKPITVDIGFNFFDRNYDKTCFKPCKTCK